MGLNTEERQDVIYFTGFEVEHTVCYGEKTLFVVGVQPVEEIMTRAARENCNHVYFGTSQSFNPDSDDQWKEWTSMIVECLEKGVWVSLDFDVCYAEQVACSEFSKYSRFVPMISVKLPNIEKFNLNATIKLDDITWGKTNTGVWTHSLRKLMTNETFTGWDKYHNDTAL